MGGSIPGAPKMGTGTNLNSGTVPSIEMTDGPELAVILINYNNESDTVACLDTLADQTLENFLTIVVDNGSKPKSRGTVEEAYDFPVHLKNDANEGFTGGNNTGIEYALNHGAEWVLLLNNDTELDPTFLEDFHDAVTDLPDEVGIVGPKIHTFDSEEIWSSGGTVGTWTANTGSLHDTDHSPGEPASVDLVAGAALMVRRQVFEDIGLLDDDFFIYYEETEFCARARAAGWSVRYVPVEGIYHKETTTHTYSTFGEYYLIRNRFLFQSKTKPFHVRAVFYPYYLIRWMLFQTLYLLLVEREPAVAKATVRGGIDALLGNTGKRHPSQIQYN